jgi:hypothetical protein
VGRLDPLLGFLEIGSTGDITAARIREQLGCSSFVVVRVEQLVSERLMDLPDQPGF